MPFIMDGRRKAFGETTLAIDPRTGEDQNPTRRLPRRNRREGLTRHGGNSVVVGENSEKQTSCGLCGMDVSHLLVYQRLTRGLCLFMKNSG